MPISDELANSVTTLSYEDKQALLKLIQSQLLAQSTSVDQPMDIATSSSRTTTPNSADRISPIIHDKIGSDRGSFGSSDENITVNDFSKDSPAFIFTRAMGGHQEEIIFLKSDIQRSVIDEKIIGRVSGNLGSTQGDHTTVWAIFQEIVYNAVCLKTIEEAKQDLIKLIDVLPFTRGNKIIIKDELIKKFEEHCKLLQEHNLDLPREGRKEVTQLSRAISRIQEEIVSNDEIKAKLNEFAKSNLSNSNQQRIINLFSQKTLDDKKISQIRDTLKNGQIAAMLPIIGDLEVEILKILNQRANAANLRGRNPNVNAHKRDEKKPIAKLRFFSVLCKFAEQYNHLSSDDQKKSAIEDFKRTLENVMKITSPTMNLVTTINKNFNENIKEFFGVGSGLSLIDGQDKLAIDQNWAVKLIQILRNNTIYLETVSNNLNELFDYGYSEEEIVMRDKKDDTSMDVDGDQSDNDVEEEVQGKGGKKKVKREKSPNTLGIEYQTLCNLIPEHLTLSYLAFDGLKSSSISPNNRQQIFNNLLNQIITSKGKGQGWERYEVEDGVVLDQEKLLNDIKEIAIITHLTGEYKLKEEEKDSKRQKPNNSVSISV